MAFSGGKEVSRLKRISRAIGPRALKRRMFVPQILLLGKVIKALCTC
jgi:hypothetical protein